MSDALNRITSLANLLREQKAALDAAKKALDDAKAALRRTETEDLPELMREIGLDAVRLADGSSVEVVDDVECGISEERRPAAHAWLEAHGFGGLIKTDVVVSFGRDERDAALGVADELAGSGHEAQLKEGVHPATLKAFIKEQMAAGTPVPFDLFGVHPFAKAKITASRRK